MLMTFEAVLKALGGPHKVAAICERSYQSICNYRREGRFPTHRYPKITKALAKLEPPLEASWSLFIPASAKRRRRSQTETNADAA